MRQLADKANRIAQQDLLRIRNALFARGRVERVKQTIVRFDARAGQLIEQRGLACIGVAHNGNHRQFRLFALAALHRAHLPHLFQLGFQLVNSLADVAAVGLQLGLARAARTDRAFAAACRLAHQMRPHAGQTWQDILVLRQFNLQLALTRAGALRENVQNQRRAIEHGAFGQLLKVARLRRRQLIVEQHQRGLVGLGKLPYLFCLALANEGARIRRGTALQGHRNRLRARGLSQRTQFIHRALIRILLCGEGRTGQPDQHRTLRLHFVFQFGHCIVSSPLWGMPACARAGLQTEKPPKRASSATVSMASSYLSRLKRFLKRSTRPPVSTSFCLPVKKGWHLEQTSTTIFSLVEPVSMTLPQAQRIVVCLYSGWMPCFMLFHLFPREITKFLLQS